MSLAGKKIIIAVTGSIAAYKIPVLVRLLSKEGADVQVLMTPAAKDFVTPLTLSALSKNPVLCDGFEPSTGKWNSHVELGRNADIILIAPVSANTLAKMANGIADNLVLTTYLAAKCPVFFAPAMDLDMYKHPATQENIKKIISQGKILIAPQEGELASGLCGAGRMEEPEVIFDVLKKALKKKASLKNKNVLITAGPTYEAIDPVRFIGNYSSGLMGFEIARECAERGANVTLVTGPVNLQTPAHNVLRQDVITADEMYKVVTKHFNQSDITIMAAAVADFSVENPSSGKIKKNSKPLSIKLKPNIDILAELGKIKKKTQFLAGFALETDNEMQNAVKKLKTKSLDMIILNSLKVKGAGFGVKTNKINIIYSNGKVIKFDLKDKADVACDIIDAIVNFNKKK